MADVNVALSPNSRKRLLRKQIVDKQRRPTGARLSTDQANLQAQLEARKQAMANRSNEGTARRTAIKRAYAAPQVNKSASDSQVFNATSEYAKQHGLTVQAIKNNPSVPRGGGSARAEHSPDVSRRKALLKGLKRRTTESSRQRLINRILVGYGETTGGAGSKRR